MILKFLSTNTQIKREEMCEIIIFVFIHFIFLWIFEALKVRRCIRLPRGMKNPFFKRVEVPAPEEEVPIG